jgi:hypothetical protein
MGKQWTEKEAEKAMREDRIQNWSYDEKGNVVVKRTMDEKVSDPDWKK